MREKQKLFALIAVGILLMTLFFSYDYAVKNINHTCQGEDCPICAQIECVIQVLRGLELVFGSVIGMMSLNIFFKFSAIAYKYFYIKPTLIRLKVELLD